jgi:spore coat protein CotF
VHGYIERFQRDLKEERMSTAESEARQCDCPISAKHEISNSVIYSAEKISAKDKSKQISLASQESDIPGR